jgi:hypothetical protein
MTDIIISYLFLLFPKIVTQDWYRTFCSDENMPRDLLAEVLSAANYMSIPPLLDLTCLKFTFELMGKSADEVNFVVVYVL